MSLSVAGVWAVGVWDQTVWADGVWREGEYVITGQTATTHISNQMINTYISDIDTSHTANIQTINESER